jgi:multicomponent Na+:H+ antiporter subunit D
MKAHLPMLVFLAPLTGVFITAFCAVFSGRLSKLAAWFFLGLGLVGALRCWPTLTEQGNWHYILGGWAPPWGVEFVLTPLTGFFAAILLLLCMTAMFYLGREEDQDSAHAPARFKGAALLALAASLLGAILTRDAFNLYLFLECSLVAAAALLMVSSPSAGLNAFRLLFWGSTGVSLLLLAVLYLFAGTGTLHLDDTLAQLFASKNHTLPLVAGLLTVFAFAFFFCFPWPSFFSGFFSQTPPFLTGFLAAVLVRLAVYFLFLIYFFALCVPGLSPPRFLTATGYLAALIFLAGFLYAAREKDFLRVLGYLSVAQLSFPFLGMLMGNKIALTGALLEVISQFFVVAGLFYIAGYLKQGLGPLQVSDLGGLGRHRLYTGLALVIFMASIVGVPPTGGFFGKFYLFLGAWEQGDWVILAGLTAAMLFTFYLFVKFLFLLYSHHEPSLAASPASLKAKFPFLLLAFGVLLLGAVHEKVVHDFIEPAQPKAFLSVPLPNVPFLGKEVE